MPRVPEDEPNQEWGVQPQPESETSSRPPFMGKREHWSKSHHEHLVKNIRNFIHREQQARIRNGDEASLEGIVRNELDSLQEVKSDPEEEKIASQVWFPIRNAWDALTYDRYQPGSFYEVQAGWRLSDHFQSTHEPIIRLSNLQIRIIDALTEAVGIPHQRGQTDIEIPEKLRDYDKWKSSTEYKERLARVLTDWEQRVKARAAKRNK
jgi:hypothetical protein